jgi:CBS domain-containing protein
VKIEAAMTAGVETVRPQTLLKDAAHVFAARGIGGLPVVDDEGHLLGVITEADILVKEQAGARPRGLRRLFGRRANEERRRKIEARTVGEAMSSPPITVELWLSVSAAAGLMIEHGVNRLPVVQGQDLVGIITRHDLVRAFARSDREIEQEIREDAFAGLDRTERLELDVNQGEVLLRGEVESPYDAEAVPERIRRVPGVVAVDSELSAYDPETNGQSTVSVHR